MFKKLLAALFVVALMSGGVCSHGYAEQAPKRASQIKLLDEAVVEKLREIAEPSGEHRLLSTLKGTWYYEVRYRGKDGDEPQISTGTVSNEMVLGGRFLLSKTSLVLNVGGQNIPYEGWGMTGYDTVKKEFTFVWADSIRSGFMTGTGHYNEKLKAIEEKGTFVNPLTGKEQTYRSVLRFSEDGTYEKSLFVTGKSGKEYNALEIKFENRQ